MTHSTANILTLSDEILLNIFNKLDNMDVLYSLIGVNRKLDRVARDTSFTQSLDFVKILDNVDNLKINFMLDRFCLDIIPRIEHYIKCLTIDLFSIDRVLRIGNYPQLHKLTLNNVQYDIIYKMFNNKSAIIHTLKNQISHLAIMINEEHVFDQKKELSRRVFTDVFQTFTNLAHLQFYFQDHYSYLPISAVDLPLSACYSSHIVCLNIKIFDFDVCYYLLDGRLSQMHTLIVNVQRIRQTSMVNKDKKIVLNLKCFSLISLRRTTVYDNLIVPFISQMFYLEKLVLSLIVYNRRTFVDGNSLVNDILSPMLYLHTFIFNIISDGVRVLEELISPPDVLSHALVERGYDLDCYTDYNLLSRGQYHIYSLPFVMDRMHIHSNKFPIGLFCTYLQYLDEKRMLTERQRAGIITDEEEHRLGYVTDIQVRAVLDLIGDSNFIVETDHKPLENFHHKQINNKRVMNWLFKLQDMLPQIIAVKYRAGANNTAADYISRHFPPSASININPSTPNVAYDDWPIGDQHWSDEVPKPPRTQFIQPSISKNTCIRNAGINPEINAVTTRAQSKLQAQPRSPSPHTSSTSTTSPSTCSSPPTANHLYDFTLSRIRSEQAHDITIQQIIQQIRHNRHYASFIIHQDILYKLARRADTTIKLVYAPSNLIPELMAAYHDHPLSGHFGTGRTWSTLKNTYYWPSMKDTITSYIKSCDKCSQFNVDRHKPSGFL
ncbi:unnamed protein product [Rotaria sordida]|uniref:F-box domain-containing protein n=1 Tax=Rotaria sordida TaxID=392033 RepID=A0A814NH04_9BILA|nr:unnamed protein product [Rotaria sordida]CAF4143539.1 unnamed protein product [Rotaria sordida]